MRLFSALILLTIIAPAFAAGPEPNRVLKMIDFEERQLGNNEDLPMHWVKISGSGLPHYLNAAFSEDRARSGQYSFRFDLNGGSLVYRYDPKEIPVLVGAHYRIECYCQTTVMPNARARLTAYFTDADGQPLPDLVRSSELYAAKADNEGWHRLSIELDVDDKRASHMAVELSLLQPSLYAPKVLGEQTLFPQDIQGTAWFDDLSVAQVPQVRLSTDRPGNIFRIGDPLHLNAMVNDLFTDDLQSRILLVNSTGQIVYQRSGAMDLSAAQSMGATRRQLIIALPKQPAGWYRASMQMTSRGRDLGQQALDLIQLADGADPTPPDPRFGVIATDLQRDDLDQLPELLPLLSAGRVKIAVWSEKNDIGESDSPSFDILLERLQSQGITPTGCLVSLPHALSEKLGGSSWIRLLIAKPDMWQPQLAYMISRHANHLQRWQLGADDSEAFVADSRMRRIYRSVYDQFAQLMHNPDLAMPWPAWEDLGNQLPATVALSVPPLVLPQQIPLYMHDLLGSKTTSPHNFSVALQPLEDRYSREVRLRDWARRVIYAVAGGATRIDLPLPFSVDHLPGRNMFEPQEAFIIDRTLMRFLAGAEYKGPAPLDENVDALLFDKNGEGIIALWTHGDQPKTLSLNLGPTPLKVDLFGNATPLTRNKDQTQITVGPVPIFLIGVDSVYAQIRSGIAFDQPLLESAFQSHTRHLKFVNPSKTLLTGTLHLRAPPGWTLEPASFQFSINPGQTFDRELTIEFPYNSLAGKKPVLAEFSLEGENGSSFSVPMSLTLGLSDVGMRSIALRDGTDLLVQQVITNYGESPIDYTSYASYPGVTRQERIVSGLEAGRTTIKIYKFKNVKFIKGATVRCGVRQLEGTRVLNDEVEIQ